MKKLLVVGVVGLLSACKGDIPPQKVPLSMPEGSKTLAPCQTLAYGGFPTRSPVKQGTFFVCRPGYALNWDPERKTAEWVVEHIYSEKLAQKDAFNAVDDSRPDPELAKKAQTQNNDYVGNGYEKIQLAPNGDFKFDDVMYSHTFYLSNAAPMNPSRVSKWKMLEDVVRQTAKSADVYVVTGTVYENGYGLGWVGVPDKAGASGKNATNGKIQVPTHYYKVVLIPSQHRAVAFIQPNTPVENGGDLIPISLPALEKMAQIRFAPDFSPAQRQEKLGF